MFSCQVAGCLHRSPVFPFSEAQSLRKRFIRLAQLLRLVKGLLSAFSTNHAREYYVPFLRKQQNERTACMSVPYMLMLESSLRQMDVVSSATTGGKSRTMTSAADLLTVCFRSSCSMCSWDLLNCRAAIIQTRARNLIIAKSCPVTCSF